MVLFNNNFINSSKLNEIELSLFRSENFENSNLNLSLSNELNTYSEEALPISGISFPFVVSKLYLKMLDAYNRILFSGFYEYGLEDINTFSNLCQNNIDNKIEYLFRDGKLLKNELLQRMRLFFIGAANDYINRTQSNPVRNIIDYPEQMKLNMNMDWDISQLTNLNLVNELFELFKLSIDPVRYLTETGIEFENLNFKDFPQNVIMLPDLNQIKKDNDLFLIKELIPTIGTSGTPNTMNNIVAEIKPILIKEIPDTGNEIYFSKVPVACYEYNKPMLIGDTNGISLSEAILDENKYPYLMFYNGISSFKQTKQNELDSTITEDEKNAVKLLCCTIYKFGPDKELDPDYSIDADIHLNFENDFKDYTKLNYLDNILCFNKL